MNPASAANTKIDRMLRTFRPIQASQEGELPKTIEVLRAGVWRTPYHGDFMITPDDLQEYVTNFEAGIGLVGAGIGAPIDFSHDNHKEAAGWIKKLFVEEDSLLAAVEWSTAGEAALKGGLYKCFSPEFYPKGRGGWMDSEDYERLVDNVLTGGGLTNIPLFKGLAPVMASENAGNGKTDDNFGNTIFIKASENKGVTMPTLDEILAKDVTTLTDEDKNVLAENKDKLSDEQKTTYGFEVAAATEAPATEDPAPTNTNINKEPVVAEAEEQKELAGVMASIKSGEKVLVESRVLASLQETDKNFRKEKAESIVKAHASRGAIKADQIGAWTDRLVRDNTVEDLLKNLPDNSVMASEVGSDKGATEKSALNEIKERAAKLQADTKVSEAEAFSKVMASDKELQTRYYEELKENGSVK